MAKAFVIKLLSILINLIASLIIFGTLIFFKNCDSFFFHVWLIPLAVAIAISGGTLLYFLKNRTGNLRMFLLLLIAALLATAWLYAFFAYWNDTQHMFQLPVIYAWTITSFVQLLFLDYLLPKPTEERTMWQNGLKLLSNPILIICLLFTLFYQYSMCGKPKYEFQYVDNLAPIQKYFKNIELSQIDFQLSSLQEIKSAKEFHTSYSVINSTCEVLADCISAAQHKNKDTLIDLKPINSVFPGIHFEHYEGDGIHVNPDLAVFKKIAESTPEKSDDDFIEILILTYGKENFFSMASWINQTTDYVGTSRLGDETELQLLTKLQAALSSSKEFEQELSTIRKSILTDILEGICYTYTRSKIISELTKILAANLLTDAEKKKLEKRLAVFKNPPSELHLNCENSSCDCGG